MRTPRRFMMVLTIQIVSRTASWRRTIPSCSSLAITRRDFRSGGGVFNFSAGARGATPRLAASERCPEFLWRALIDERRGGLRIIAKMYAGHCSRSGSGPALTRFLRPDGIKGALKSCATVTRPRRAS